MACMEHLCRHTGCNFCAIDNSRFTSCPEHPGETMHFFDEPEHDEDPDDREEDDDERE